MDCFYAATLSKPPAFQWLVLSPPCTEALDDIILYLASDASRAVTGEVFDIDDGQSL